MGHRGTNALESSDCALFYFLGVACVRRLFDLDDWPAKGADGVQLRGGLRERSCCFNCGRYEEERLYVPRNSRPFRSDALLV